MTPTTYGRDFAYCLKSHGGVRGFNASLWRFLLRCTLFCHSVATFLTSVSSYEGGCGFEAHKMILLPYLLFFFYVHNVISLLIIVFFRLPCPPLAKRGSLTHSQALALSKRARDVTAPPVALNRCAIRLAGHQSPRQFFVRVGTAWGKVETIWGGLAIMGG